MTMDTLETLLRRSRPFLLTPASPRLSKSGEGFPSSGSSLACRLASPPLAEFTVEMSLKCQHDNSSLAHYINEE